MLLKESWRCTQACVDRSRDQASKGSRLLFFCAVLTVLTGLEGAVAGTAPEEVL
jgi:hypothetical protein